MAGPAATSQRFGRESRLRRRVEFTAVQNGGRRVSGRYLTLLGRPNALTNDRLGVVASRKVGGAVVRNRAKRRLRDVFRRRPSADAGLHPAWDLVAIAKSELAGAPFPLVETEFLAALRKLRGTR